MSNRPDAGVVFDRLPFPFVGDVEAGDAVDLDKVCERELSDLCDARAGIEPNPSTPPRRLAQPRKRLLAEEGAHLVIGKRLEPERAPGAPGALLARPEDDLLGCGVVVLGERRVIAPSLRPIEETSEIAGR